MKHLTRIILAVFVFACVMPAFADSASDRVSQWKKDRLRQAEDAQPIASASDDNTTWTRANGARERDGRTAGSDRFPGSAPGLVPNGPNGSTSQSLNSDTPTGDDADSWWWGWYNRRHHQEEEDSGMEDESEENEEQGEDEEEDFGDDEGDEEEEGDASPYGSEE